MTANRDHLFIPLELPADQFSEPLEGEVLDGDGTPIIDGAELLHRLRANIQKFVVSPSPEAADAITLWIVATHVLQAFQHATRLVIKSPEKRCGKSRLLDIIRYTCHDNLMTTDASTAAIIRSLDEDPPPTLLIDEADALWGTKRAAEQNEDLRSLINAGFQRGRDALRCVGPNQTPTKFKTFSMAALAGIKDVPDTISDRAVVISLRRRKPDERVTPFRERRDIPTLTKIRDELATWAVHAVKKLLDADEPDMPVEDRAADTWEPLVLIADLVGGDWPERARAACKTLTAEADESDEESSLNLRLLSDIRDVFTKKGTDFVSTTDLVAALKEVEESPWDDFGFNANKLARRLKDYGVRPGHDTTGKARGYRLDGGLYDAFARYLRQEPSNPSDTRSELRKRSDGSSPSDGSTRQTILTRQNVFPAQAGCLTGLTVPDDPPGGGGALTCSACKLPLDPIFADEGTHPGCDLDE